MSNRNTVNYFIRSPKLTESMCMAVISDLHNAPYEDVLPLLHSVDAILVVGDLVSRHHHNWEYALRFLKDAPQCAPTYYSIGNHERKIAEPEAWLEAARDTDVVLLDNTFINLSDEIILGGFSSPVIGEEPDAQVIQNMSKQPGFKLLMSHHPEHYKGYIRHMDIDLTISGHAHGGHWRFFDQGIYAPGQGLFPKLTRGLYDNDHLLVSMGMSNETAIPRINAPCELILLHLMPEEERIDPNAE